MGKPNVYVDNNALDNGSWRRFLGGVGKTMEPSGEAEVLAVEFIVQADTLANFISRVQSTESDFVKTGARVRFFTDDGQSPLYDWSPNDGVHPTVFTAVEWIVDETPNVYNAVMRFYATASRKPVTGAGGGSATDHFAFTGQASEIRITEEYAEDGTVTMSASGHFAPTVANSGAAFTLTDVENSSGYAKFKCTGTMPTFVNGMRIIVAGTTAYNGTHYISGITGQYFISKTAFGSGEATLVGATAQVQLTTSGEDNYNTARSTIMTSYLGCSANGAANTTSYRALLLEHVIKNDPDGNDVDFILTAGPQRFIPTALQDGGGNQVSRGYDFQLAVSEPEEWFPEAGPKPKIISATGTFTIDKLVVSSTKLYQWYTAQKTEFTARVASEAAVSSSGLKLISTLVAIDYTLNSVKFTHIYRSNWTGVISFSREYAESTRLDYSAWSDSDGYDVMQRPNRAVPKTVVVTTSRVGEGRADLTPPPPTESGYTYIEINRDESVRGPFITEFSNNTFLQTDTRTYIRFKFKQGGGSFGMQLVNPSV